MLVKAEGTGKSPAEAHVCPGTSSGTKSDVQDVPVTAVAAHNCRCHCHCTTDPWSKAASCLMQPCSIMQCFSPASDYTPPAYVTLLITDLGGACFATFARAHSGE